jgi:hypothetical protein
MADLLGIPLFDWILGVHMGEPVPRQEPVLGGAGQRHAVADVVLAERSGVLTGAPGELELTDGGVRLSYRPQRPVGEQVTLTRTNRDYLGTIRAIGPSVGEVEAAIARFRAAHTWTIA